MDPDQAPDNSPSSEERVIQVSEILRKTYTSPMDVRLMKKEPPAHADDIHSLRVAQIVRDFLDLTIIQT